MCQTLFWMKSLSLLFPNLDLNQYVVSDSRITLLESQDRKEVFHFFAPHQNEVLTVVYEKGTENGKAVLDINSLYQIRWKVVDGKPEGEYEVLKFCVCRCIGFINEDGSFDRQCYIECSSKSTMAVHCDPTTGNIIYRGGMGRTRFEREGFGAVYDGVSGNPLYFGVFYHNRLYRIYQKFINGEFMVEYAYEDDNTLLHSSQEGIARYIESHPAQPEGTIVYRGGFRPQPCLFFMRSGEGCEIRNGVTRYGIWRGDRCIEQWSTNMENVVFDCLKGYVARSAKDETPRVKDETDVVRGIDDGPIQLQKVPPYAEKLIKKADTMLDEVESPSPSNTIHPGPNSDVKSKPESTRSANPKPASTSNNVPKIVSSFIPGSSHFTPSASSSSLAPAPMSVPTSVPMSAPAPAPMSAPTPTPTPTPTPMPTPTPTPTPKPTPISAPTPATIVKPSTPPPPPPPPPFSNSVPFGSINHQFVPSNSASSILPPKPNTNSTFFPFTTKTEVVTPEEMNQPPQSANTVMKKSHEQVSPSPFVNGSTVLSESSLNSYFSNSNQQNASPNASVDPFIPNSRSSGGQSLSKSNSQSSIRSFESVDKSQSKAAIKPFMNVENPMASPFIPGSSHTSHFGSFIPSLRNNRSSPMNEQTQTPVNESTDEKDVVISSFRGFQQIRNMIVSLTVTGNCCNEPECNRFDLSMCANLKTIRIEDSCFRYVTEVSLKKMECLEELSIGMNCFQGIQNGVASKQFCLEENDSLLTLKIGANSFVDYDEFILRGS